jgi:thermostable 8-oxoguanine DNA glycosylase
MQRMQQFIYLKGVEELTVYLPEAFTEIMPEVRWGAPCSLFTPAYWYTQYIMRGSSLAANRHRMGQTFVEEMAACLLGGHGVPAEVGNAAFRRLKDEGLIREMCDDVDVLEKLLHEPLQIGNRRIRYRFWKQKARYLADAFRHVRMAELPLDDAIELRNKLMLLRGIGPKTASWIVRNWMDCDSVAILDIHIVRAGMLMNLYRQGERVDTHYLQMEEKFVMLARKLTVPTSDLDALIWSMMRATPRLVGRLLEDLRSRIQTGRPVQEGPIPSQAT